MLVQIETLEEFSRNTTWSRTLPGLDAKICIVELRDRLRCPVSLGFSRKVVGALSTTTCTS